MTTSPSLERLGTPSLLIPQQQRSKTMKFNPDFNADHKMMVTGSFNPTPEAPTCNGREMDWTALTELPKQETVRISKQVMSALWKAPCPTHLGHHPKIDCDIGRGSVRERVGQ